MTVLDLRWLVCDIMTGQVLSELPLSGVDEIETVVAREDSQTFTLAPADDACPADWTSQVVGGKTMIVALIDDQLAQAWIVNGLTAGGSTVPISCSTLETCLNRTNVPDLDGYFDDVTGAATLCAELTTRFGFTIESTPAGHDSDFDYSNLEDRNLLDVMHERMQGESPIEWRIALRWADAAHTQIQKVLEIAKSIGIDRPDAVFELDATGAGNIESYGRNRSYIRGKGATMMIGTSEGTGDARPVTDPIYSPLVDAGWPVWEERSNFTGLDIGTVEEEDALLRARTIARLAAKQGGTVTWSIVGSENAPRPGVDYDHGDTVHIAIDPQGKQDPEGGTGSMRVLGWRLNTRSGQTTLIAWDEDEEAAP